MEYSDTIRTIDADFDIQGGAIGGKRPLHVLLCIHGIRDDGSFATRLGAAIARDRHRVLSRKSLRAGEYSARIKGDFSDIEFRAVSLSTDERISTLDFLCDARLQSSVELILKQMREARLRYPNAAFSVLAHSFGTKMLALVLAKEQFDLEWVFLCASVAKKSDVEALAGPPTPIADGIPQVAGTRARRVVNDACGRDMVPILAEMVRNDTYSATGVYGFNRDPIIERCFMHGHSPGLAETHIKDWILTAIAEDRLPRTPIKNWGGWKHFPTYARRLVFPIVWAGKQLGRLFHICPRRTPVPSSP